MVTTNPGYGKLALVGLVLLIAAYALLQLGMHALKHGSDVDLARSSIDQMCSNNPPEDQAGGISLLGRLGRRVYCQFMVDGRLNVQVTTEDRAAEDAREITTIPRIEKAFKYMRSILRHDGISLLEVWGNPPDWVFQLLGQ